MKQASIFIVLWVVLICCLSLPLEAEQKEWVDPITSMEFVWIEGGCFKMGQSETEKDQIIEEVNEYVYQERFTHELPQYEVCVDGFWMGKYEVTNAQYRVWKTDYASIDYRGHSLNEDDQPVVYISWNDAKAFIKWLTEKHKNEYTFRLPTEAEWEYACRAGTTTARFWGDKPDKACQYANVFDLSTKELLPERKVLQCHDGYTVTAPVGSFLPNAFGLYDMLGNVWEFCEDVYVQEIYAERNQETPVDNPLTMSGGEAPVRRGGGWYRHWSNVRCASRGYELQTCVNPNVGIRLVRIN